MTPDMWWGVNILSKYQLSSSDGLPLGCNDVVKIWRKSIGESMNELISHGRVCRTAPATPGLLNILEGKELKQH